MISKILVAFDASAQAEKAFDFAVDLASRYDAQVIVVAVARPPEPPEAVELQAVVDSLAHHYETQFAALGDRSRHLVTPPSFVVRVGHPADQIIVLAREESVDLIVMGHRGRTFVERWLLGSVSKRVLSYAPCAVLVVR